MLIHQVLISSNEKEISRGRVSWQGCSHSSPPGSIAFIKWLDLTLSRQQLHDYPVSCDCHAYARAITSRAGEQHRSHHQVAAVDVEGRAGDVAGGLGGGEANQIGDFECGAEARHGIARGKTLEQLVRRMFAR